jgi:hypothetical protein
MELIVMDLKGAPVSDAALQDRHVEINANVTL